MLVFFLAVARIRFISRFYPNVTVTSNNQQFEAPITESEYNLIGYDPFDFASGLPQRNYSRADAKVHINVSHTTYPQRKHRNDNIQSLSRLRFSLKIKRLQNGGVTSDEDVSITGSPSIRRRLGSCSGGIADQQSAKDETYSPGNSFIL